MEWLDEFRLSENEKEDEEVWFIKYRSLTFSKIDPIFSYHKCISQDLDGLMDWWSTVEREFFPSCWRDCLSTFRNNPLPPII